eukprot:TRINITY_DN12773_c0_g1_i2.p1 TRINITY_DN12773_c0_g1~~TRINITY_DN12773_c0_g1_i2.p1  ORF type:complete len:373 (+),score=89.55 TRINITY_DN12773_c0_g1_i2:517-1635(+)
MKYIADWIQGKEVKIIEAKTEQKSEDNQQQQEEEKKLETEKKKKEFEFTDKSFTIYESTNYIRRFYYEQFEKLNYRNQVSIESKTENNSTNATILELQKMTSEELKINAEKVEQEKWNKFYSLKGFSRIFDLIEANKKLTIVGHNCFLDLMFMMSHFNGKLDDNYQDYKQKLHSMFPRIYDTKILTNRNQLIKETLEVGNFTLERMYELSQDKKYDTIFQDLKITFPQKFTDYKMDEKGMIQGVYHNAGFDAFLTGLLFLKLGKKIGQTNLQKYENIINFFGTTQFKMNLNGNDLFYPKYEVYVIHSQKKKEDKKTYYKKHNYKHNKDDSAVAELKGMFTSISNKGFWLQQKMLDNQCFVYIIMDIKHEQKK